MSRNIPFCCMEHYKISLWTITVFFTGGSMNQYILLHIVEHFM